jgi:glycerol-3-phosphate acyltransferase PlsX
MKPAIALDAMGGDFAPANTVAGAILAARELGSRVVLVGREDEIQRELARHRARESSLSIVHASESVAMDEAPAMALRRKKDSSLRVAANLVRLARPGSTSNSGIAVHGGVVLEPWRSGQPALMTVVPSKGGVMSADLKIWT